MKTKRAEQEKELQFLIENMSDKGVEILLQFARKVQ